VAAAQCGEARQDELERGLHLRVRVCDAQAAFQSDQPRWQGLTGGTALNLALSPGIHAETEDVQFGLAEQPP
jgi:hypothetical protein